MNGRDKLNKLKRTEYLKPTKSHKEKENDEGMKSIYKNNSSKYGFCNAKIK